MQDILLCILLIEYLHKFFLRSKTLINPVRYPTNKTSCSSVISKQLIILSLSSGSALLKNFVGKGISFVFFFSFNEKNIIFPLESHKIKSSSFGYMHFIYLFFSVNIDLFMSKWGSISNTLFNLDFFL